MIIVQYTLPEAANMERTQKAAQEIEDYFLQNKTDSVKDIFSVAGYSFSGSRSNAGMALLNLKDWKRT